jgi:hypothetical protein
MASISSRVVAAGLAGALALGSASSAYAIDRWGAAALGVVGGAVLGSAIANSSRPAYAYPAPVYGYPAPAYSYAPPPATVYTTPAPTYYTAPAPTYYSAPATTYYSAPATTYTYSAPATTTTTTYSYSAPSTTVAASNPHIDWCYANRPGYNAADNTFQPAYGGAREYCQSPYGY